MSDSGKSFKRDISLIILGALLASFGAYAVNWISSHQQQGLEEKNVALALYIDISDTSDHFASALENYNISVNQIVASGEKLPPVFYDPRPYYRDNGIYFAYLTEIYKFDSDISKDIYEYYKIVVDVELKRKYIDDHYSKNYSFESLSLDEQNQIMLYSHNIPIEMNNSINLGNRIKTKLDDKYHLGLDIPRRYDQIYSIPRYSQN